MDRHDNVVEDDRDATGPELDLHLTKSAPSPYLTHDGTSSAVDDALPRPRAVRINVTGAFIDEGTITPLPFDEERRGAVHDTQDIRLPHHTGVVSHVAVDVGRSFLNSAIYIPTG